MSHYFHATLQPHNSPVDFTIELFNSSKDSASPRVCNEKQFFGFGFCVFCECHHKWGRFLTILAQVTWPCAQLLDQWFPTGCPWAPQGSQRVFGGPWPLQ